MMIPDIFDPITGEVRAMKLFVAATGALPRQPLGPIPSRAAPVRLFEALALARGDGDL